MNIGDYILKFYDVDNNCIAFDHFSDKGVIDLSIYANKVMDEVEGAKSWTIDRRITDSSHKMLGTNYE